MALIVIPTSQAEVNQLVSLIHTYKLEFGFNRCVEPTIKVGKPVRILTYIGVVHTEFDLQDTFEAYPATPNQLAVELKYLWDSEVL